MSTNKDDDFETTITFTDKEIEVLGNVFTEWLANREHTDPSPLGGRDPSPQSALLVKILNARERAIKEAWATGKLP